MTQRGAADVMSFDYPATPGTPFFTSVAGTYSVQSTYARNGRKALRLQAAGAGGAFVDKSFHSSQTNQLHGRFYIYFVTLPDADCWLFSLKGAAGAAPGDVGIRWRNSTGKLFARVATSDGSDGPAPTTGIWYRVDFLMDNTPSLAWEWAEDGGAGVAQPTATHGAGLTGRQRTVFGDSASHTAHYAVDDFVMLVNASPNQYPEYPTGDGECFYLAPDGDGTHNNASDFTDDAANSPPAAGAYARLDEGPSASTTDYVYQDTGNTASYLEFAMEDIVASPNRMHGAVQRFGRNTASGTAQRQTAKAYSPDDSGDFGSLTQNSSLTSKRYFGSPLIPVGGSETNFSIAKVNNGVARLGFQAGVAGTPRFQDYHQEWAIAPTPPPTDLPYWDTVCV